MNLELTRTNQHRQMARLAPITPLPPHERSKEFHLSKRCGAVLTFAVPFALVSLLTIGCSESADPSSDEGNVDQTQEALSLPVGVAPPEAQACSSRHWVGKSLDVNNCPVPAAAPPVSHGSWVVSKLFSSVSGSTPAGLAGYCAYDWQPDMSGLPSNADLALASLPADIDGRLATDWLARDCHVAAAMGEPAINWSELHRPFLDHAGAPHSWHANNSIYENVHIGLLDTMPTSWWGNMMTRDNHGHGLSLGSLLNEITCPKTPEGYWTENCLARVQPYLALPLITPETEDLTHGGNFGRQTHLARAIFQAVDQWRLAGSGNSGKPPRLVLNMSVGWEPRWGGHFSGSPEKLSGPVRAVYDALQHASCWGVLSYAAAGNEPGVGVSGAGAVFPAAWASYPAPMQPECDNFEGGGYLSGYPLTTGTSDWYPRALVEAVGGVDNNDRDLVTSRSGARPRLVASGANGFGVMPAGQLLWDGSWFTWTSAEEPTTPFTGSSVSTAIASAAAAAVWAYQPDLPAWLVAEIVHFAATPVDSSPWGPISPDVILGNSGWIRDETVRRVSVCRAVQVTCTYFPSSECPPPESIECPDIPPYAPAAPMTPVTRDLFNSRFGTSEIIDANSSNPISIPVESPCPGEYVELTPHTPAALLAGGTETIDPRCPQRQDAVSSDAPWVNPMPISQGCPSCLMKVRTLDFGYPVLDLDLRVDASLKGPLDSPVLLLKTTLGTTVSVDISRILPSVTPGTTYRLTGIRVPTTASIAGVAVTFKATGSPFAVAPVVPIQFYPDLF